MKKQKQKKSAYVLPYQNKYLNSPLVKLLDQYKWTEVFLAVHHHLLNNPESDLGYEYLSVLREAAKTELPSNSKLQEDVSSIISSYILGKNGCVLKPSSVRVGYDTFVGWVQEINYIYQPRTIPTLP